MTQKSYFKILSIETKNHACENKKNESIKANPRDQTRPRLSRSYIHFDSEKARQEREAMKNKLFAMCNKVMNQVSGPSTDEAMPAAKTLCQTKPVIVEPISEKASSLSVFQNGFGLSPDVSAIQLIDMQIDMLNKMKNEIKKQVTFTPKLEMIPTICASNENEVKERRFKKRLEEKETALDNEIHSLKACGLKTCEQIDEKLIYEQKYEKKGCEQCSNKLEQKKFIVRMAPIFTTCIHLQFTRDQFNQWTMEELPSRSIFESTENSRNKVSVQTITLEHPETKDKSKIRKNTITLNPSDIKKFIKKLKVLGHFEPKSKEFNLIEKLKKETTKWKNSHQQEKNLMDSKECLEDNDDWKDLLERQKAILNEYFKSVNENERIRSKQRKQSRQMLRKKNSKSEYQ